MVLNDVNGSPYKVYSLTWSEFASSLSTAVRNLRNLEDLTDLTVCAGGKIFSVHKLILSAASPLLMELLKNAKCQHPILMLAGISSSDFESILDFVYVGEINVDSERLPSLLQAAQLLDIQALSPNALVLNSPPSEIADKNTAFSCSNESLTKSEIIPNKMANKVPESAQSLPQRKRSSRPLESSDSSSSSSSTSTSSINPNKKSFYPENLDAMESMDFASKSVLPRSVDEFNDPGNGDEKKIISDLPVNCKLCGVTIRQSRNLRRHMDQMHSKRKPSSKSKNAKCGGVEEKSPLNAVGVATQLTHKVDDLNNDPRPSTLLNFSDDSFTQLTEEILKCAESSTSASTEHSFAATAGMQPSVVTSNITSVAEPLNVVLCTDSRICSPLKVVEDTEQTKFMSSKLNSSANIRECSNIDDSCNMNEVTLKELENQLFSACFCSVENDT